MRDTPISEQATIRTGNGRGLRFGAQRSQPIDVTGCSRLLFGGVKQSGLGRGGGHEGMLEYVKSKYIAVSW